VGVRGQAKSTINPKDVATGATALDHEIRETSSRTGASFVGVRTGTAHSRLSCDAFGFVMEESGRERCDAGREIPS